MTIDINKSIYIKKSSIIGKTIAIIAGTHGNETVGVQALQKAIDSLTIKRGTVYFIFGNPKAINQNTRLIDKNLNRCFSPDNTGKTYEDKRAQTIMKVLDTCDTLLDLHAYNELKGGPFIIVEPKSLGLATFFDMPKVTIGWEKIQKGCAIGYMDQQGKHAIALECGPLYHPEKFVDLAYSAIVNLLQFSGTIDGDPTRFPNKVYYEIDEIIYKRSKEFSFTSDFVTFDKLPDNIPFAKDGKHVYSAHKQYIIFPRPQTKIGGEAAILCKKIAKNALS